MITADEQRAARQYTAARLAEAGIVLTDEERETVGEAG